MYDQKKQDTTIKTAPHNKLIDPINMKWEDIKTYIRPCLAPTGWDCKVTKGTAQMVHDSYLDLAIYYHIRSENTDTKQIQTSWITHTTLELWDITPQILKEQALRNIHQDGYTIQPINDLLHPTFSKIPLYVLINQQLCFGAAGILDRTMIAAFSESLGTDLYVLPSSIHEVLFCPDLGLTDTERLDQIVREVNMCQVEPYERLSDHVYYYDRKQDEIRIKK